MIQSRCGILCSELNCKEAYGFDCNGCVNVEKAPWGECEVKNCCEEKKLEQCGECNDFPCDMIKSFSYDEVHGDNGKRISQCEEWSKEKICK